MSFSGFDQGGMFSPNTANRDLAVVVYTAVGIPDRAFLDQSLSVFLHQLRQSAANVHPLSCGICGKEECIGLFHQRWPEERLDGSPYEKYALLAVYDDVRHAIR